MQQRNHATALKTPGRSATTPSHVSALLRSCVFALLSVSAACAHTQARTVVELPPLEMPAPPPRVVEANEPPPAPVISLPDEPRTTLRPRPAPAQRTEAPRPPEPPKPEPATTEPARPVEDPPRPAPPTTLQTTPTQRENEVERRVHALIGQALNDLNHVNYQALNGDARNQYDTAKRFAAQAEEALRARNLVFANNLADKAAALAAQLLGR
jgi:outer membrane biosynthesis protein TonB